MHNITHPCSESGRKELEKDSTNESDCVYEQTYSQLAAAGRISTNQSSPPGRDCVYIKEDVVFKRTKITQFRFNLLGTLCLH